ncbi:DUF11 domain-containing protein [Roseiconus nitratireducens]|nr:DUF11 domain-containing protein [Roseiconus nitratireducens]
MKLFSHLCTAGPLLGLLVCLSGTLHAQQSVQTGDGLLQLDAEMPEQTEVGQSFKYQIRVTNSSDNVTLHDIKLKQRKAKGFTVESVSTSGDQGRQSGSQGQQSSNGSKQAKSEKKSKNQKSKNQSKPKDSGNNKKSGNQSKNSGNASENSKKNSNGSGNQSNGSDDQSKDKQSSGKRGNQQASNGSQQSGNDSVMTIAKLEPGQSKMIHVQAAADEEGQLKSCLEIVSYTPALCLMSQVVKPELELTKTAPKKADRCDVVELEYTLKNGGSGDVGAIQITDQLGDGLATIEGDNQLKFDIDQLKSGETRRFVAQVYAAKPGDYSSRAVAKATNSDLKSRSKKTSTKIIAADLDVQLDGPSRLYGNQLATFTAMVTNTGNAPAKNVRARVMWPSNTNLADLGEITMKKKSNSDSSNKSNQKGTPTVAESSDGGSSKDQSADQSNDGSQSSSDSESSDSQQSGQSMSERVVTIDELKPGQTAQFEYAIRSGEADEIPTKVDVRYVCTVDAASDQADAKRRTTSMAMAKASVVRLPAMQLVVIDDEDPAADGEQVVYTVRVWNEGDAKDQNVKLNVNIPDGLTFVSAEGPTEHSQDGSTVTFEPVDSMGPGDREDFKVTTKSKGKGNVLLEAKLTSKSLNKAVAAEEPTRLFSRQAQN